MKLTLVGFIFMYEKVRIFLFNKSEFAFFGLLQPDNYDLKA